MFLKVSLLLGFIVLGTHVWTIQKEFVDISKNQDYFVVSMEFAMAVFNDNNVEENAYRLLEVRRAKQKRVTCSFLVGALPWNGDFTVMKKQCADF
uniref:Cystatin 8 n=1 Tax=Rousettus aegyptiacus TaxID=9407 RepID=A0A7J8DGH9_ROUAE|nr:cystatin 8 [Rousettus aegyptiacus]